MAFVLYVDDKPLSQVLDVNVNGVLFTAQAAGRQMARFGNGGSIVLIASMSGSITNKVRRIVHVLSLRIED